MPLAPSSIVDPGEVESKAPLKKSTVGWMLVAVLLLAVAGVFLPKLLKGDSTTTAPRKEKPVGVGTTRQIDGEFEDVARRTRQVEGSQAQASQPVASAAAGAASVSGQGPSTTAALPPIPKASTPLASGGSVVPEGAKRAPSPIVMYGRQMESATSPSDARVERDAAARTSNSLKTDFGDSPVTAAAASAGAAGRDVAAQLKALVSATPSGAASASSAEGATTAERIAAAVDAQRKANAPSTDRGADRAWLKEFAEVARPTPLKPYRVTNPFTLLQGKVLPAVLGGDLNTDLPGGVTAYLSEDVYDSLSSQYLLIPKGSVLIGRYSNAIKAGQDRILFAFERIILPNGVSVDLPGFGGQDRGGAAGLEGDVNNHFFQQFGSSFLIAFLADRADRGRTVVVGAGGQQGDAVTSAGRVLSDVSSSILSRSKSIDPTITVRKGTPILVSVAKDIEFTSPYRSNVR